MKVLHIIDSGGVWGAENMLFELVAEQQRSDQHPVVLSIGKPGEARKAFELAMESRDLPFEVFRMPLLPRWRDIRALVEKIKELAPDLIHSHGYKGNILLAFFLRRFISIPTVTTMHGWTTFGKGWSKLRFYEFLDAFAVRRLDGIVLVSEKMRDHPRIQSLPAEIASKVVSIDNGISVIAEPTEDAFVTKLEAFAGGGQLIGSVGRMSEEKGYQFLIPAFARIAAECRDVKLVLIGDGHYRSELEALISELGLEGRVWITGYVKNAGALIGCLDAYICSSLIEGLPITLLEAMRESVPVVSTAISNIPALLQHGEGGVLVAPADVEALATAITGLLAQDAERQAYATVSQKHFLAHYSAGQMAKRYAALYRRVLSGDTTLEVA